jgi:hypothetical protein
MARRSLVLWMVAVALVAAGCGVHKVRHVTTTITVPATGLSSTQSSASSATATSSSSSSSTAPSTTATQAAHSSAAGSQVAGRSPRAIVAAAARALRTSDGYTMRADLTENGDRSVVALTADGPRTYQATLSDDGRVSGLVTLPGASYLRGNRAFWSGQSGSGSAARARAARLAGHWLKLNSRGAQSLAKSLGSLAPDVLARCLVEDHGTLTLAGHTTIGRTPAVIVKDAGDAPGATPSTIAIAASGSPDPLRYTATGPTRRGGRIDVCNSGKGGDNEGTIDFSQFGQVPAIQAPTGATGGGANT